MNANQRAARYALAAMLQKVVAEASAEDIVEALDSQVEQTNQHIRGVFDYDTVEQLVRRYAEALSVELGFEAEQNIDHLKLKDMSYAEMLENDPMEQRAQQSYHEMRDDGLL